MIFPNRKEAGFLLSEKLQRFHHDPRSIVLSIARGGVVVGAEIAKNLHLPLDIVVIKKVRAPGNPELAIGAVAPRSAQFVNWELALRSGVEQEYLDRELSERKKEVEEKVKKFKISNYPTSYKTIILVDDGVATGATIMAALRYIGRKVKVILAVPVITRGIYDTLESKIEIVALAVPHTFNAVGEFYKEFPQVTDEEVLKML